MIEFIDESAYTQVSFYVTSFCVIIFSLTLFGIVDPWPHSSS